jgi:hypothetical protein
MLRVDNLMFTSSLFLISLYKEFVKTRPPQFQNTIVETKTKSTSYLSGAPEFTLGF